MIKRHEITDEQWERIKDLVPLEQSGGKGHPTMDNRMMINTIIWILKTGARGDIYQNSTVHRIVRMVDKLAGQNMAYGKRSLRSYLATRMRKKG